MQNRPQTAPRSRRLPLSPAHARMLIKSLKTRGRKRDPLDTLPISRPQGRFISDAFPEAPRSACHAISADHGVEFSGASNPRWNSRAIVPELFRPVEQPQAATCPATRGWSATRRPRASAGGWRVSGSYV